MEQTIQLGDRSVPMRASAATVRYYRDAFHRDLLSDLSAFFAAARGKAAPEDDGTPPEGVEAPPEPNAAPSDPPEVSIEVFENLAYIMARQADPTVPPDVYQWLEQLDTPTAIDDAIGDLLKLWFRNTRTEIQSKKNEK